jgi:hypothetical protein
MRKYKVVAMAVVTGRSYNKASFKKTFSMDAF